MGKPFIFEWEMAISGKTFTEAFCRLKLLIDKAMICGKTFMIE